MVDLSSNQFNVTIPSSFLQHAWNLSSLNWFNSSRTRKTVPNWRTFMLATTLSQDSFLLISTMLSPFKKFHYLLIAFSDPSVEALQIKAHAPSLQQSRRPLPPSLTNCTNLVEINLGFNHFSGNITALDFSKLTQPSKLDFINNALTGILPINLYSCKSLKALRLATNDFEGQIQSEILQLKNLTFPSLVCNRLTNVTGAMKIFTGFKSLRVLILSENFQGQIPPWILKFRKLEVLDLSFNRLTTGTITGWLGTLPSLFFLLLSDNLISGEFPREPCRLQALVSQKAANQTGHCSLELPIHFKRGNNATMLSSQCKYVANMPRVTSLGNKNLSGSIPFEIGQLQFLQQLDLSINNFSDNIPDQISNLTELERLELNSNRLLGEIPSSLSSLHFLSTFIVAYNNLEGSIPADTQLQGFNASAFEGNPKLCGTPLPNQYLSNNGNDADQNENNQDLDDDKDQILWVGLSFALGFVVGFLGFCCPLLLKRTWRNVYFQFLDNVQFKLYLMWRRLGRRKLDSGAESTNCSEYASKGESFMIPDNFQTTSLFSVPVKAPCPEDE
ncbi:hypothetical protein EV2_029622 [Malus domestica]